MTASVLPNRRRSRSAKRRGGAGGGGGGGEGALSRRPPPHLGELVKKEEMVLVVVGQKARREPLFRLQAADFAQVRPAVDENAAPVAQVQRVGMRVPAAFFACDQQDPVGETPDHGRCRGFPAGEAGIGVSYNDFHPRTGAA